VTWAAFKPKRENCAQPLGNTEASFWQSRHNHHFRSLPQLTDIKQLAKDIRRNAQLPR